MPFKEFRGAYMGRHDIKYAVSTLYRRRILLEADSATVTSWISDQPKVMKFVFHCWMTSFNSALPWIGPVQHAFGQANSAADSASSFPLEFVNSVQPDVMRRCHLREHWLFFFFFLRSVLFLFSFGFPVFVSM